MKVPRPSDPRAAPIVALRSLMRLPDKPDQESAEEARLLKKLEDDREPH